MKNTDENILYGQLSWTAHFKSYLLTNLWRLSTYIELATVMMWLAVLHLFALTLLAFCCASGESTDDESL